jgi:hypothetical protein
VHSVEGRAASLDVHQLVEVLIRKVFPLAEEVSDRRMVLVPERQLVELFLLPLHQGHDNRLLDQVVEL